MTSGRISFYKTHNDVRTAIQKREMEMNTVHNQLATQNRLQKLSEDPNAAAHGTRYASVLSRKEAYKKHNRAIYDSLNITEGYARQAVSYLQSARELAVRAANGTFTEKDRAIMAEEINEHLEGLHALANSQDADGRYVFSGTRTHTAPFRALRTASLRMHKDLINDVEYVGSNNPGEVRISEVDTVARTLPGSTMFWTRHPRLSGGINAFEFSASLDSIISINNVDITIDQGDSVYAVIEKINRSLSTASASLDPATGAIVLQGDDTEQLWLNDTTGEVLSDLGLISDGLPPYNIAGDAQLSDETVFDSLIRLRDALFEDDYNDIGGRALAALDGSLTSVVTNLSKIGAASERLDVVYKRIEMNDIPTLTRQYDGEVAIDISETITRMAELSIAKETAYAVGTRMMSTTLLDFLK